jgi:hypothetical protein
MRDSKDHSILGEWNTASTRNRLRRRRSSVFKQDVVYSLCGNWLELHGRIHEQIAK